MDGKDLIEHFKTMTLAQLTEFVKDFEETFGVSAAVPQQVVVEGPSEPVAVVEEQDEFDVILEAAGEKKIAVIKEVRVLNKSLSLSAAKAAVDSIPTVLLEKVDKDTAQAARAALEAAGAVVTVK